MMNSAKYETKETYSMSSSKTQENSTVYNKCGALFYTEYDLRVHVNAVHLKKDLPCECHLCNQSFSQNGWLVRHIKQSHLNKELCKKFQCLECEASFVYVQQLTSHMYHFHVNT